MDLTELKAKHPAAFAAAHAEGVAAERDRVNAHLTLGTKFKQMSTAIAAIKAGDGLTAEISTRYIDAAANELDIRARQMDSDAAGAILENVDAPRIESRDLGDVVADMICGPDKGARRP